MTIKDMNADNITQKNDRQAAQAPDNLWWSSPEQFSDARRLAKLGCWDWDVKENRIDWSEEMYEIYEVAPATFRGSYRDFLALIHPADQELVTSAIDSALETQRPCSFYHRLRLPAGEGKVVHVHGQPVTDEAGAIIRVFGTVQDVSSFQQSKHELTRRAQQIAAMTNIGHTVTATDDLSTVFAQAAEQVQLLTEANHSLLFLDQDDEIKVVACSDSELDQGATAAICAKFVQELMAKEQPFWQYGQKVVEHLPPAFCALLGYQPHAILVAPVHSQEDAAGIMIALAAAETAFANDSLQFVEGVADWIAIALANARKQDALKEQIQEMETIIAISRLISETVELQRVLKMIVEAAKEMVCEADWSVIHIYNEQSEQLEAICATGLDFPLEKYTLNLDEGIAGEVFRHGQFINVADLLTDERALPSDLELQSRSLLVVPMKNQEKLIGTITVQCYQPGTFGESDERLLTALGLQACIAIQNGQFIHNLEDKHQQLHHLSQQIVSMQEEERFRIAQELHDDAGQLLTALGISLGLIREDIKSERKEKETFLLCERIENAIKLVQDVVDIIRRITYNLRPPALVTTDICTAIEGLCESFMQQTGIAITYTCDKVPPLSDHQRIMLYRIVQESLTNVARHADAKAVTVELTNAIGDKRKPLINLKVSDNGKGFFLGSQQPLSSFTTIAPGNESSHGNRKSHNRGIGLLSMAERCELLNATFEVISQPNQGTTIMANIPVAR